MRTWRLLLALLALLVVFALPARAQQEPTIADVVIALAGDAQPEFTTLLAALQAADPGILEALSDPEIEVTVFAPTDEAFATLLENLNLTAEQLLADQATLDDVLLYHVIAGAVLAEQVVTLDGQYVPTLLDNDALRISVEGDTVKVDSATVIITDVETANGIIHVIDAVLLPDGISSDEELVTSVTIGEIVADFADDEAPEFTILYQALLAADPAWLEALNDADVSLTVFAPTDAAFEALFAELEITAEDLLADTALLDDVLAYHVMSGYALAEDIAGFEDFPTLLENSRVTVTLDEEGEVLLNGDVRIIVADVELANGVVHVIDKVLLPPDLSAGEPAAPMGTIADQVVEAAGAADAEFTTLLAVVTAADPSILRLLSDPSTSLTVFAPTDAAFEALFAELGISAAEALQDPETLTLILQYHVMSGYALLEDLKGFEDFPTLVDGARVTVTVDAAGDVILNDTVRIIVPDIEAANGVIHVIDAVLIPPLN